MAVCRVLGALVPALLSLCAMGQAVAPEPPNPEHATENAAILGGIIKDLGSDDVTLRLDAQRRLIDASNLRLRDIEAAIRKATLNPEQSKRLLTAAFARFCAEPRAGMGVQSEQFVGERGVVLQSLVPGFPSGELLRVGDRLLSVDGRPINDISSMRPVVIARDPGDEVPVVLVRGGTTLNLKIRLGKFADLNQRDRFLITSDILDEAWEFRSAAIQGLMAKTEPPIESGLPPGAQRLDPVDAFGIGFTDGGDPNLDPMVRPDTRRLQTPDSPETMIAATGEPRGDGSQIRWAMHPGASPTIRLAPGIGLRIGPQGNADAAAELKRQRDAAIADLRNQQTRYKEMIGELQKQLAGANDAQRRRINEQIARLQRRVESIDRQAQSLMVVEP